MSWLVIQSDACHIPLADASVSLVLTSPSYWPQIIEQSSRLIGHEHTITQYIAHLGCIFEELKRVLKKDGLVCLVLGDGRASNTRGTPWRVVFELERAGWYLVREIIWDRREEHPNYIFLLSLSKQPTPQLGGGVWNIAPEPLYPFPFSPFPFRLVELVVRAWSREGDVVLDPMAGAMTVPLVASQFGRRGVGLELDWYCCRAGRARLLSGASCGLTAVEKKNETERKLI